MRLRLFSTACAVFAFSLAARADTYKLFQVNGTFQNGAILSGTVNFDLDDSSTGAQNFDSMANFNVSLGGNTYVFNGTNYVIGPGPSDSGPTLLGFANAANNYTQLYFQTDTPGSLASYDGGPLSAKSRFGTSLFASSSNLVSGTLVAVTPEPSSLALLGTGLLGVLGAVRRRTCWTA